MNIGDRRTINVPSDKLDNTTGWLDGKICTIFGWDNHSHMWIVDVDSWGAPMRSLVPHAWLEEVPVTKRSAEPQKADGSKWQDWREDKPGYCPCGILRSQCSYHS